MRLLIECFNQWLSLYGIRTQKAHRILEALGKESLKLADKDRAERQFEVEYLTDAMGEYPWRFSKDRNEWVAWTKTVVPYMKNRESSLIELARTKGLSKYPYPIKNTTSGGPGNKATYEIVAFEISGLPELTRDYEIDIEEMFTEARGYCISFGSIKDSFFRFYNRTNKIYSISLIFVLSVSALTYSENPNILYLGTYPVVYAESNNKSSGFDDGGYKCGTKATCKEMSSCNEAQFFLMKCGCETLCK